MFITNAYAQAAGAAPSGMDSLLSSLPVFIAMIAVMYFLMVRPQMKRNKEQKALMDGLKKNDEIVTVGGILGKVTKVTDNYVTVEIATNTEVVVQKSAITLLLPKDSIKTIN